MCNAITVACGMPKTPGRRPVGPVAALRDLEKKIEKKYDPSPAGATRRRGSRARCASPTWLDPGGRDNGRPDASGAHDVRHLVLLDVPRLWRLLSPRSTPQSPSPLFGRGSCLTDKTNPRDKRQS